MIDLTNPKEFIIFALIGFIICLAYVVLISWIELQFNLGQPFAILAFLFFGFAVPAIAMHPAINDRIFSKNKSPG